MYIALCPAAHTPRRSTSGRSVPVSTAGIQSACSTQLTAASNTSGSAAAQRRIFAQYHSALYRPPHLSRYSGRSARATSVIRSASAYAVWSFQSHTCAAIRSRKRSCKPNGLPAASTGIGVEPVVSTPIPITHDGWKPSRSTASASAARTLCSSPSR